MTTQQPEALPALIERFRGLHFDHAPDGWPAVRTREITALLDRIAELEAQPSDAENLRKALQFYADKQHFAISEEDARDTAMVEDGSIAKMALAGQPINFADEDEDEAAPPTSAEGVEHE